MRCCLLLPLLLIMLTAARCQEYSYVHYDVKDGLAASVVYCAAEDKEGFLWFGTEAGLSRYDGTHFRNFTTSDGLPDNEVMKLFVDSRNRVWITPFKNSVCYYWKGKIYNADNDSLLHRLRINSELISMAEDRYGNIVLMGYSFIDIICPNGQLKQTSIAGDSMALSVQAAGLGADSAVNFFLFQKNTTNIYTLNNPAVARPSLVRAGVHFAKGGNVNTSLLSPGLIVFRSRNKLVLDEPGSRPFSFPAPGNLISIAKMEDSLFAVNTTNGTLVYSLVTKKQAAHFLPGQTVNAMFSDSEGNLWLMCAGSGIFRLSSRAFRNYTFPEQGTNLSVCSIMKAGASLLVGTERYFLWLIDPVLQKARKHKIEGYAANRGRVLVIKPMGKNSLLLGTDGGLIKLVNLTPVRSVPCMAIKSIGGSGQNFLVSSARSVFLCRPADLGRTRLLWKTRSTCSYQKDSLYYIGTFSGLYTTSFSGGRTVFLGNANPVFKSRIADIRESADGILWIATSGRGVAGYKNNQLLYLVTEKDGLTSNVCRTIAVSGNDIWVGTDKGLSRIHREGGHFTITKFSSADGLASDIINTVYVDGDNVYVGTSGGLTYFNTGKIAVNSFCKLRITAIQTSAHAWAYDTSGLVLPRRESSLRVEFAGISYRSAGDITYRYRLLGLNDDWSTTRETALTYPTLPPGRYELQLAARNKFGVQSDVIRIQFVVEKLLWEKTWFILLMVLLAAALVWLLVSLRIRELQRKNQEKLDTGNRIAELEQMALKAQMNPHFIFNSLNSIQQYVIDKDFKGINKFISGFSRLIRLTLEISSKTRISVEEEVKYISTYLELEKSRFENKFNYEVRVYPGVDQLACFIPPMILQPYIENSIRHGVRNRSDNEGRITVSFAIKDRWLVSTIEDNGVGRAEAGKFKSLVPIEYQSRGMSLTASRVEMINKTHLSSIVINIEDMETAPGRAAGTRVTICFPPATIIKPKSIHHDQSNHYR